MKITKYKNNLEMFSPLTVAHGLPRKVVHSLPLEVFKTRLEEALSNLV